MPALAEIFKTAEDVRQFTNVSCSVNLQLYNMKNSIQNNLEEIDEDKMKAINTSVK